MGGKGMRLIVHVMILLLVGFTTPKLYAGSDSDHCYCNIYLDTLCFGVKRGDVLTMQIPVDFVLYDIKFHAGGHVRIYYGDNPSDVEENEVLVKREGDIDAGELSLYRVKEDRYRIICRKSDSDKGIKGWLEPIMDMDINGITSENYRSYNDFLFDFATCKTKENNVVCSGESAFGKKVFDEKMFAI